MTRQRIIMAEVAQFRPSDEPMKANIGLDQEKRGRRTEGLEHLPADSCLLRARTHGFHGNVIRTQSGALHVLFKDLFAAVDEIAERMRALGCITAGGLTRCRELARLKDENDVPSAVEMLRASLPQA